MSNLGSNIRKVRVQRELTQEGVAAMTGMSRNAYVNIENGHNRGIQLATLEKVAKALNVRVSYLLDFGDSCEDTRLRDMNELKKFVKETITEEFRMLQLLIRGNR